MPCTSCGTEFGIFRKEHGCKNCGFSFCGNCLVHKALIPKLDQKKHSVCATCFELLSGKTTVEASASIAPPAALQRRIDALHEKQTNNSKDQILKMRLDRLREEKRGHLPSDKELEERLARLKDLPTTTSSSPKPLYIMRDNRTNVEQSSSLINQMTDEVRLDTERPRPEDEIARRLQQLRSDDGIWNDLNNPGHITAEQKTNNTVPDTNSSGNNFMQNFPMNIAENSNENLDNFNEISEVHKLMEATRQIAEADAEKAIRGMEAEKRKMNELKANRNRSSKTLVNNEDSSDDDEDENKLADKVIEKLLAENALDERTNDFKFRSEKKEINTPGSDVSSESEELPWCTICNEDATLRCNGCDGELYCHRCFKECHDSYDLRTHTTINYNPPKRTP